MCDEYNMTCYYLQYMFVITHLFYSNVCQTAIKSYRQKHNYMHLWGNN